MRLWPACLTGWRSGHPPYGKTPPPSTHTLPLQLPEHGVEMCYFSYFSHLKDWESVEDATEPVLLRLATDVQRWQTRENQESAHPHSKKNWKCFKNWQRELKCRIFFISYQWKLLHISIDFSFRYIFIFKKMFAFFLADSNILWRWQILNVYDGECGRVQELHREEGDRAKAHALPYLIM